MTTPLRFAALSCSLALALSLPAAGETASGASAPVVIERAPEPANPDLERQVAELRAENQRLQSELAAATRAKAQGESSLQETAQELAALRAKLARSSTELQQSQARLNEASAHQAAQESEKKRADDAGAQATALQAQLEQLRKEKAEVDARLAAAEAEKAQLQKAVEERNQLAAEIEKLRQQPAAASPELTAKLAETETKLEAALRSFTQLQTENDQLKSAGLSQSAVAAEVEELRRKNAELETRLASAPPPPPDLAQQLAETEDKLNTVLRSYSLLERDSDLAKAEAARGAEEARTAAAKAAAESAAQISALFDELRQTQAQSAALAAENAQLKTRIAVLGPPPGSTLASPARPGATPPPATTPAPAPAAAQPRTHVVVAGDNLAKLSRTYYGTANRWDEILNANRDVIQNENVLPIGATLRIP
ncbi:LysM peptidoglycan-binding domain-containing protein [Opitutus terrae]|uniref:Peptidoglycan-binding LysM n=1 Tax=Opitutus terrae (strain DSM 11246 / JCM 15787 / PB90-1) TaxID=452637 RepID=B1ZSS7_OPITP|nr:LysM peptidoglycan-binding domain-containing protein [Opitutus terrae]ACB74771.1 Peptidoglycan-binding LysM [Opitutus terrae PB90-1]